MNPIRSAYKASLSSGSNGRTRDRYNRYSQKYFERVTFDLDLPAPPEVDSQEESASTAEDEYQTTHYSTRRTYMVRPDYLST